MILIVCPFGKGVRLFRTRWGFILPDAPLVSYTVAEPFRSTAARVRCLRPNAFNWCRYVKGRLAA